MERICVFCGSNPGADPAYAEAAADLGRLLAGRGLTLIYGGGHVGLMGVLADAALAVGGRVTGVIPEALAAKELAHGGLTDLKVVGSMHERKALMSELSDAFIALPGGIGTLEELLEVTTWSKLGIHAKQCGVLNVSGYYDPLGAMLDATVSAGFMAAEYREILIFDPSPTALLDRL